MLQLPDREGGSWPGTADNKTKSTKLTICVEGNFGEGKG